jgi:hypothetical protein
MKNKKPLYAIDTPLRLRPEKRTSRGNYRLDPKSLYGLTDYKNGFNDYHPLKYSAKDGQDFYKSDEWIETRNKFKEGKELKCCKCGSKERICVDHKLPLRRFWQYRHLEYNLQLLCHSCNKKKLNHTDYNLLREIQHKIKMDELRKLW